MNQRSRFWSLFLLPAGAWLLVFFAIPLIVVFGVSIGRLDALQRPYDLFGGNTYYWRQILNDTTLLLPLWHSLLYASLATFASLVISYPTAYAIARYGGRWKALLLLLVLLPFWVNYVVRTYAWLLILADQGLLNNALGITHQWLNTPFAVVFGLTYSFLPFMILPIYAAIERIDRSLLEAASDLYGSPWEVFRRVTLPLSMPGIIAGCVLNFLPGFGDFVTADLLGGPSTTMIGNVIEQKFQGGEQPGAAVLTFVLMALLSVVMVWYLRATMRQAREAMRG